MPESTTPDLMERVQRVVDTLSARDLDAMLSFYAADAVRVGAAGTFKGHAEIRRFFEEWTGAYEDFAFEAEDIRDLGNGVAFAACVARGRLPGSAGWVQVRVGSVATWTGGLIERTTDYADVDRGRAAAERLAEERG